MAHSPSPAMDALDRLILVAYATHTNAGIAELARCSLPTINLRVRRLVAAGMLPPRSAQGGMAARIEVVPYSEVLLRLAALELENDALRRGLEAATSQAAAAVDQARHAIRKLDELHALIARAAGRRADTDPMLAALHREARTTTRPSA
jgi:DNA-binding Lrp family transcriptional regulator